ncbi:MAG: hypothetical protein L0H93_08545 [Nocardioides sp.]|nr:hypothetical protein [Nocardioides sp.]
MSDFEFHPDVIGSLPTRLLHRSADIGHESTLPSPDAGAATAGARSAITHIELIAGRAADSLDGLADAITACLEAYAEVDDDASLMLHLRMEMAI